ncbi:O-antigen ligase family protein [Occallatibacter riparius]|uniref:O-antigen ligase family protein n=1 Tax=Occallatibacter riparius TaxID=1002689 RepID=A0A9J7BVN1_9BACT|nr:O-antigen ligase family protein [Occallatibacter riparius]UWZ86931.1 O-antigen ligase family protein [Occallatibacter riparius]
MKYAATAITVVFICWLFQMDRHEQRRASWVVWIPVIWFGIICSRPVSVWLQPNRDTNYVERFTEGSPVDATVYGLLILVGLLVLNRRAARMKQFLQLNLPLLLFFLYCAVSLSWSDAPMVGFKRWIKAVGDLVMVLLVLTDVDPEHAINRMYARVGFVLLPMSVLFIVAYPALGTMYDATEHVTMYTGVTTFKNELGVLCMACGLGALWSLIGAYKDRAMMNRGRHMIAQGITFLLALGLVIRADSMTSFSSFLLAGAVMVLASLPWMERRAPVLVGVFVTAVAAAGFSLFLSSGAGILESLGRNSTLTGRTTIWKAVLAQKINPLTGAGFESFWMGDRMEAVWSMSQRGIQQAHDGYLELYLNLGWMGLALIGVLIVTGFYAGLALYRRDAQAGRLRIALMTAELVYVFTEAGFRMMSPDWLAFLLAITVMPLAAAPDANAVRLFELGRRRREVRVLQ